MSVQYLVVTIVVVLVGIAMWRLARAWWKFRGERVVTCPENRRAAGVAVDAAHAAATAFGGTAELRLSHCSRWPEKKGCGQECLAQIEQSPAECLVRNILSRWYDGKVCANCGKPFGELEWSGQRPAILKSGKVSMEWSEIPADVLHEVLAASLPLCFACHMANTLVREHPELAVDRAAHSR